jgi:hypothetical protein
MTELVFTGPSGAQLVAGTARPWGVRVLEGWEARPNIRSGSTARESRHGSFTGPLRAIDRPIRARLVYRPWHGDSNGLRGALDELRAATGIVEETAPTTLDVTQLGEPRRAFARCVVVDVPQDEAWIAGAAVDVVVEWHCPDPHRYRLPVQTIDTGPSIPGAGGLVFPLSFPLRFGTASTGGTLQLTNTGNAPAWPVFEITGPGRALALTEVGSGRALRFDANYVLTAGQVLRVDTGFGERGVTLAGVSRSNVLINRQWFGVPPGGTISVALSGLDMTGTTRLRATWYHTEV